MSSCNRKHTNPTAHIHSSEGQNMTVLICTDTRLKNNIRVSDLSLISDTDIRYFCHICLFFLSSSMSLNAGLWQEKTSRICSLPVCIVVLSKTRRPLSPEHGVQQQSSGTSQTETLNLMEAMNGFMENSCVESVPAPFPFFSFHLMNEISHAALLQALAHLGGRALSLSPSLCLSLSLSLMPSNTLLPLVNYWHTFWQQTHH